MTITVKARHPALGAEIRGVDMRRHLNGETLQQVRDAWMKHLVVVFPDQPITDAEHVAFTRHFGEPEIFHQTSLQLRSDRVKEIFLVSNVDEQGRLMRPSEPSQKQLSSARQWHTDSSYRPMPSVGSLLHGIEISRTGGITQFINMYRVYDDLPESLRGQVEGRKARHDFSMLSRLVGSPPPTAEEKAAMPPVWHPMVRKHPVTGRKCLYISS
ncbi:MAG: TauD/TfdA dioxygenase family protein, partial [Solimonas sp.]